MVQKNSNGSIRKSFPNMIFFEINMYKKNRAVKNKDRRNRKHSDGFGVLFTLLESSFYKVKTLCEDVHRCVNIRNGGVEYAE